jgi:hypothetical protein
MPESVNTFKEPWILEGSFTYRYCPLVCVLYVNVECHLNIDLLATGLVRYIADSYSGGTVQSYSKSFQFESLPGRRLSLLRFCVVSPSIRSQTTGHRSQIGQ